MLVDKQLNSKIQETLKDLAASEIEVCEVYDDCVIVKYEAKDPLTGDPSGHYFYTICDMTGKLVDEEYVYDEYEICRLVLHTCSMNNPTKIDEIVESYNAFQKILREAGQNEFYDKSGKEYHQSTRN